MARLQAEVDRIRAEARDSVEQTHRHYRRDLVPVRQSVVVARPGSAAAGRTNKRRR